MRSNVQCSLFGRLRFFKINSLGYLDKNMDHVLIGSYLLKTAVMGRPFKGAKKSNLQYSVCVNHFSLAALKFFA